MRPVFGHLVHLLAKLVNHCLQFLLLLSELVLGLGLKLLQLTLQVLSYRVVFCLAVVDLLIQLEEVPSLRVVLLVLVLQGLLEVRARGLEFGLPREGLVPLQLESVEFGAELLNLLVHAFLLGPLELVQLLGELQNLLVEELVLSLEFGLLGGEVAFFGALDGELTFDLAELLTPSEILLG